MTSYGKSDRGCVRPTNQDAFAIDMQPEAALLAVCDGMGGANAGNVASRFAIETFMGALREGLQPDMDAAARQSLLRTAVERANDTVYHLSVAQPEFRGMGTTLVGCIAAKNGMTLVNVGDSRAYCVHISGAQRLTEDHSYVEEMMRRGKLTEEAARVHPNKNLITRAIGIDPAVECDLYEVTLAPDDALLLCSDGLSGMVRDEEIARIVCAADTLQTAGDALVEQAKENGGQDNITVVLYRDDHAETEEA